MGLTAAQRSKRARDAVNGRWAKQRFEVEIAAAVNRLLDEREAQGLARHLTEPVALGGIAVIVQATEPGASS